MCSKTGFCGWTPTLLEYLELHAKDFLRYKGLGERDIPIISTVNIMEQSPSCEANSQLVSKSTVFYETRGFTTRVHIYDKVSDLNRACIFQIPIRATYPANLILLDITLVIIGGRYKLWRHSLRNFLHNPVFSTQHSQTLSFP
jgi:hypothetical protein